MGLCRPGPGAVGVFLVYPAAGTILRSLQDNEGQFTLANFAVLEPEFTKILRNNVLWLIVGTGASVMLGLLIAGLFDRVRRESLAKTFVFLPLAISLVGASVIWGFIYAWQPAGSPQIGLLNAIVVGFGGEPIPWLQTSPINVFCEILILVWLQTGFAMVVFSAAIKGVSGEVIEAARLDGASERQLFLQVIVPMIRGSIVTVATTIAIVTLKIFDIVLSTTGGRFNDDVVAVRMFQEIFQFFEEGRAAALATLLFIAVLPVMYINLRNFRRQQAKDDGAARPIDASAKGRAGLAAALAPEPAAPPVGPRHLLPVDAADARPARHLRADPADDHETGWWTALLHPFEQRWTLSNYETVIASDGMGDSFINSLIVTIPSMVIPITIAAFAAYAFAWIPFRGRGILFTIVVALLVVPLQMSLIPILQLYSGLGLYGTFLGIWLAHTAFGLPLAIFLLYNFMSQLPRDLFESAAIDGASAFQTFIRIVLPLSIPALGAFAIFQFLWVWNDLLVALVFLGPGADVRVLPTALYNLIGAYGGSWHLLTAGAFITMIVPLIVFLVLQRAFVRGILAGSVK